MKIELSANRSDYLTNSYISEFTNHATVDFGTIVYEPEGKRATIPFIRYPVTGGKTLLGLGEYRRNNNRPIQSKAVIRNIEKADLRKADSCKDITEIELIFGISIKYNEIYFCSVEEASGETFYEATFFGENLILELEDKETT